MIWVINWEYKWVLRLFWLFKSYKILHVECDIWPVDSAKSCGRASNMATGLYAVSYTITHGSSVLHSKVQTVEVESETFNSLFKSSKSVDCYRIIDVLNGLLTSFLRVLCTKIDKELGRAWQNIKQHKFQYKCFCIKTTNIWCQNVSKGTILFKYSTKLSTWIVKHV